MSNSLEQVQDRYNNIASVEPLLDALRTISLGSWQQAINKRSHLETYQHALSSMFLQLVPIIEKQKKKKVVIEKFLYQKRKNYEPDNERKIDKNVLLIVVGSERGLCGNFNGIIANKAKNIIEKNEPDSTYDVWAIGSRLERYLKRLGVKNSHLYPFSQTSLPEIRNSLDLVNLIFQELDRFDQVSIVYNHYISVTKYVPTQKQLIPFIFPQSKLHDEKKIEQPIIETDPIRLIEQVTKKLLILNIHDMFMKSATAEHATRFSLMEEATQNAERLLEDINQDYQSLRRQLITREMIDLAVGAGLINTK